MDPRPPAKRRALHRALTYGVPARRMARTFRNGQQRRKPYAKTRKGNRTNGSYRGKSFGAKHVTPFVHRSVFPGLATAWPLVANPAVPGTQMLDPLRVLVPAETWGQYTRGFDVNQVTSSGIRSRNVTMRVTIKLPTAASAAQPFRLRVVQCWIKSPMVGYEQTSTVGTSSMMDGLILNYNAAVDIPVHAERVLGDSIGQVNGEGHATGNISSDRVKVISDSLIPMTASNTVDVMGVNKYVYPTYTQLFNFKTEQTMRLLPATAGAAVPADPLNINMVPLNNPLQWTPCIGVMLLNASSYTGADDQPRITLTQSHYWTQN